MRDGARSAQHQDSGAENSSALKGRDQQPVGLGSRRRPKPGANGHGAGRRRGSVPPQRLPGSEVRRGEGALRLFQAGSAGVVTRLQLVLLAPDRHQGARERSHARLWRQYAGSLPPPRFWPPFSSSPTHAFPQPHPAECDLLEDKAGGTARRRFCSSLQQEVCSGRPFTELAD